MRQFVTLWLTPTSADAEYRRIVRASDVEEAIASFMRAHDLGYAHVACAYPSNKRMEDISAENWRYCVRCSITGKVSFQRKGQPRACWTM